MPRHFGDITGPVGEAALELQRQDHVRALVRERGHNEAKGKPTDEIDEQLRHFGHQGKPPAERAATREQKQGTTR
jgi:hypothetical protein